MERISSFFFTFFLFGKLVWMWIILCRQIAETQGQSTLDRLWNRGIMNIEKGAADRRLAP